MPAGAPLATRRDVSPPGAIGKALLCLTVASLLCLSCTPLHTPRILKIGIAAPFEGRYRDIGYDAIYAARLAVREINIAGGVEGSRLELVAYDDRGELGLAARVAGNLATDPDVVAVIGHYRPETSAVAASVYAQAGLPYVVVGGWGQGGGTTRYLTAPPDALAQAMTEVVADPQAVPGVVLGAGDLGQALAARGWTSVEPERPITSRSVVSLLTPVESAEWLTTQRDAGWTGQLLGDADLASPAFGRVAGSHAAGTYVVTSYPFPQDLGGIGSWIEGYLAMGPHVAPPGPYALPTYEAVYLIAEAIATASRDRGGGAQREAVGQALISVERAGLLGEIRWDAEGSWDAAPLYVYRWDGGEGALSPRLLFETRAGAMP